MGGFPALSGIAWALVVLAVVALWASAMSEIGLGLRRGLFPPAQLAVVAVAVSAVAVFVVFAAGAAFSEDREAAQAARVEPAGCGGVRGSFVFGFGIEQAPRVGADCARGGTGS